MAMSDRLDGSEIAVIGMAGRFPGARNVDELWHNLCRGVEAVRFLTREEVLARGIAPELADDPAFVPAESFPADIEMFDAAFFDMSHREAEVTDPQHRLLLECAWDAFCDAGYDPLRTPGAVGVFAGATLNTYLLLHVLGDQRLLSSLDPVQVNIASAGDFLTTRVSYKLNLQGPSHTVQSACSTSLVAVALACQKLFDGDCDLALAGGVSINVSLRGGYRAIEGGMMSPDGRCRPFDARAGGTIFGGGAGLVVLKRLREALADGDTVRAVIRGVAVNNDGWRKIGYTAPSVEGQARVVAEALANAGVSPATIGYVEAHGTATPLGDPVEVQALTRAFRAGTDRTGFCALGSIKGNLGHLDAAGGVAGLIKAVLALERERIPPSLHYTAPNPEIDFAATPFYVNAPLAEWRRGAEPRRAGVSAFGVGGTNAHVVLEEAPPAAPGGPARPWQLLVLSARTSTALAAATADLASCLESRPELDGAGLADAAFTLQQGRRAFEQRRALVCRDREDAVAALRQPHRWRDGRQGKGDPSVAFLFPGQGAQATGMAAGLYAGEPVFQAEVDGCCDALSPGLGDDLRRLLSGGLETDAAARLLAQTEITQPALFIVATSLARLLAAWGVRPAALLGHSLGEYAAACVAGVFSRYDALRLVAARGRLMQELPAGGMLAVPLSEEEIDPWLDGTGGQLALAAVNGPGRCVVAGPLAAIRELEERLAGEGFHTRRLQTSHAFHSPALDPVVERFSALLAEVEMRPPAIPFLSNLTGTWIRAEEATDPGYWTRQMLRPVRFAENLDELLCTPRLLLEVGPGKMLSQLARRHPAAAPGTVVPALDVTDTLPEPAALLDAVGRLWAAGVEVDWRGVHGGERRRRVPLPGYPFERSRYWIDRRPTSLAADSSLGDATPRAAAAAEPAPHPRPALETVFVAPGTDLERRIAGLWQRVLGVDRIGVHDNFFALGGDSLLALKTIDLLRSELGREIPATNLYEGVSVRELARLLDPGEPEAGEEPDDGRQERMVSRKSLQRELRLRRSDRRMEAAEE
jgi:phthiocerol/phenolphthiocerol synthesis type-I polyketide synthase E